MIQWYPGHMAKARRIVKEDLKLVDLVVEVLDARIPYSSSNPEIKDLLHNQERIIVLNKVDLADQKLTAEWKKHLEEVPVVGVNALQGNGIPQLIALIKKKGGEINKTLQEKGRNDRAVRIMIIGIPNVGKSALINALAGTNITRTGNRPGVTRGRQWIKIGDQIRLLDTPGILWPKFEDQDVGYKLAITGAIKDVIFDMEMVAYQFITYLLKIDPGILEEYYDIEIDTDQPYDILPLIGRKRGCLMSGGRVDRTRASETLITEYRKGKLGPITLEKPEQEQIGG